MDRRTFNKLTGMTALGAITQGVSQAQGTRGMDEVILEDDAFLVAFDSGSGALTRMVRKSTGWMVERRPELGMSFRLLAPLPHRRANYVLGQKQRAARVEKLSISQVRLSWSNMVSEHGGALPVSLTAKVTLDSGKLTFEAELINNSELWIETIDYPYFGDLSSATRATPLTSEHMWYGNLVGDELYPSFVNEKGYWGVN